MKSSKEIRNTFLKYFEQKQHQIVKSAPIVVKNDPTLMFTNAGMNQFKDIFLGLKSPQQKRCADTQKCLRVAGKHNDLDEVGIDTYHHTMFEMLGNWSFGDYYKAESIEWAWKLLTEVYEIDPNRLYVTIFEGDAADGTQLDADAQQEWKKWIPMERIIEAGKKDNFWEMGESGPAGPCSEIHIDLRSDEEREKVDGKSLVNADHPEVIEIWNLVFIQFNRKADGSLEELPDKHIDTGMGFERLTMALQGKNSTYDIDLFDSSKAFLKEKTGIDYEKTDETKRIAIRVIIDHIRAIVFAIADGATPSNVKAGYVIRRILRRASLYAAKDLNLEEPFLNEMVPLLAENYRGIFDEVTEQEAYITRLILEEEKSFLRTLGGGRKLFDAYVAENASLKKIDGEFAFKLYDTYGFPLDLTQLMGREIGWETDIEGFEQHLKIQKDRSRKATEKVTEDWVLVAEIDDLPEFVGYDNLSWEAEITRYRTIKTKKKDVYQLVLKETPFYAESGGQVGDKGLLRKGEETIKVLDTQRENELIVHLVDKLPQEAEGTWKAEVHASYRNKVKANHTATHLLHAALRAVLGAHVEQRGSLVSDKALRFDFSHFGKMSPEELQQVEQMVNEKIAEGIHLQEYRSMPIDQAKEMGAMALFGEKYGDNVRVIVFDPAYSVELCGGIHVNNTQEIRLFKLTSEASAAAGIRRIEAYTADRALEFLNQKQDTLDRISELLKNPKNTEKAVADLNQKNKDLEKELQKLVAEKLKSLEAELVGRAKPLGEIRYLAERVEVGSADALKQLSFSVKKRLTNTVIVLAAAINQKPLLSIIISDDLAASERFNAGKLVRELSKEIKGGGGGQAFYATAGGKTQTAFRMH